MLRKFLLTLCLACAGGTLRLAAQCSSDNHAFQSGETLSYDLYFNWKFVWVKVGTASMNTTQTTYNGQPAYRNYLITRGSERADKYFVMRDTLMAYTGLDLVPFYYTKRALEGDTYRREDVWYSYPNGQCAVKMRFQKNNNPPSTTTHTSKYCAFDMLSMLLRARSFDTSTFKPGQRLNFLMAEGKGCEWRYVIYRGKKNFTIENTQKTYRCLVFSYMEKEDNKEKEIVKFYITDDKNHVPVRIDMNLKFGSAKAYLRGMKGLRN